MDKTITSKQAFIAIGLAGLAGFCIGSAIKVDIHVRKLKTLTIFLSEASTWAENNIELARTDPDAFVRGLRDRVTFVQMCTNTMEG